jgi:glycosyltransferase involved in cell wall biosynthesis
MKIGLVTPYIYPLPGGVNAHVRYLYENLIARGHDVRIISSVHGPQRTSEGDIIRLGYGFSVPANGSVWDPDILGRATPARFREMLERERFDVLHFHEPFVPFPVARPAARVAEHEHRHVPCVRGLEPGIRVRQALPGAVRAEAAWRIAVSAGGAALH